MTLSVCMIVKDEETFLEKCLRSLDWFYDELIIVDTGSTDKTKEIAARFGAKVFDFKWVDDFSAARNFSLEKATSEWILVLDADELIENKDDVKKLMTLDFDAFTLVQKNFTYDKNNLEFVQAKIPVEGYFGYIPVEVVRLFRNKGYKFSGRVHELVDESLIAGKAKVGYSDAGILHLEALKGNEQIRKKQIQYLEYAKKQLEIDPEDEKMLCDAGLICFYYLKDYLQAEEFLKKAKSARAKMLLGQMKVQQGDLREAARHYEGIPEASYNLGEIYFALGVKEKSILNYMNALKNGSKNENEIRRKLSMLQAKP